MLPISAAAERNKTPILAKLRLIFAKTKEVLELGSGSGQHAVYFARSLPTLNWQPTEIKSQIFNLQARLTQEAPPNVKDAIPLDVACSDWRGIQNGDGAFTANTFHILSEIELQAMVTGVGAYLLEKGQFAIYGPFNENGAYTSPGNVQFDAALRQRDPRSGIRDLEWVVDLGQQNQLFLTQKFAMPANNLLLVFEKRITINGESNS